MKLKINGVELDIEYEVEWGGELCVHSITSEDDIQAILSDAVAQEITERVNERLWEEGDLR